METPIWYHMGLSWNGESPSHHGCFNTKTWSNDWPPVQHVPITNYRTLTKHWPFRCWMATNKKCTPHCIAILTGKHVSAPLDFRFAPNCLDKSDHVWGTSSHSQTTSWPMKQFAIFSSFWYLPPMSWCSKPYMLIANFHILLFQTPPPCCLKVATPPPECPRKVEPGLASPVLRITANRSWLVSGLITKL